MTENTQENQVQTNPNADKELNFRKLEARYQQELATERARREESERRIAELSRAQQTPEPEEEDTQDPYVDHKRLDKKLNKFGQNTQQDIKKAMEQAKIQAKEELKQEIFLETHPDFDDVLQKAEEFAMKSPKLAETILRMPQGFERQKLVYHTIKEMGLDKPQQKAPTIQEKIDSNKKSPYYQPSGVGTAPYNSVGNFSADGQKQAYDKMQELKSRLRL